MKKLSKALKAKSGMTLVEVLTALTILTLMIFCFAPLFLSYLNTINISGNKLKETYNKAGLMQTLIGNKGTGSNSGYECNVSSIPLSFTSPQATITRGDKTQVVNSVTVEVGTSVEDGKIDPISGNFIFTDPTDVKDGFSTIYTNSLNSTIKCFPTSLTDDFVKAYITVVADGFNFVDNNMENKKSYKLSCTVAKDGVVPEGEEKTKLVELEFGKDYKLERIAGTQNLLLLTLYGGTEVCFENSPLVFDYNNGQYKKKIEVDAPQMIMVGEQSKDKDGNGKYYYYVSRGETDEDGNLIVLRREMKSDKGTSTRYGATLTSAMNDVEWVPAESGDGYNSSLNGEKYGYYVMCGDNGQVRRFWKNENTGNYYWGGDYTYYTDINYNTLVQQNMKFKGEKKYSDSVSYKYVSRRDNTQSKDHWQNGFNMANNTDMDNSLLSANVWSVTAFGDDKLATYFYASDGKAPFYTTKGTPKNDDGSWKVPSYSSILDAINSGNNYKNIDGFTEVNNLRRWKDSAGVTVLPTESYTWLEATEDQIDGYYKLTGQDKATTNPITLTCVDAMVLSGSGGGYYNDPVDDSHEMSHVPEANRLKSYPQQSYTLYCGYIPAAMDAWSKKVGQSWGALWDDSDSYWVQPYIEQKISVRDLSNKYPNLTRAEGMDYLTDAMLGYFNREWNGSYSDHPQNRFIKWKGNFGITPYLTDGGNAPVVSENGQLAVRVDHPKRNWEYRYANVAYYPYTNVGYAVTGKFFDEHADITGVFKSDSSHKVLKGLTRNLVYNTHANNSQSYITNGKVIDITLAYLSHPLATHIAANPTDDMVYDMSNDKLDGRKILYWNNSRETVTFLDCASTLVPYGETDIPVSLMVGYVMGGLADYWGDNIYVNTVMNNGIVFLRAGTADIGKQNSNNSKTGEYYAKDKDGYKLNKESNVFHQFYYLNSRTVASTKPEAGDHIGNLYGAHFWQNNQHIDFVSMREGGEPGTGYNYLRCHPLSNTKVTCVAWGQTWDYFPEAMWGTENGTVLSWFVNLNTAKNDGTASNWNDRSVSAEFQSYKWIDNVNGRKFDVKNSDFADTVGANGQTFSIGSDVYPYCDFYDKCSRSINMVSTFGMISVLETINDIAFDNDVWIAVGDQSGKDPADYCASGSATYGGTTVKAYTGNGRDGSWVNVRYWIDYTGDKVQGSLNNKYVWKTVKISDQDYCNIVQINNMNGVWYATGYIDGNKNGDYDDGEKTVVCWASDPLKPYGTEGGWTDATKFLECRDGVYVDVSDDVGGINSVATRT